jgi:hypothetical protein
MHYVGMDCHISTLDFAVVNEGGRLVKAHSVATSVNGFMEFVKKVPLFAGGTTLMGQAGNWADVFLLTF